MSFDIGGYVILYTNMHSRKWHCLELCNCMACHHTPGDQTRYITMVFIKRLIQSIKIKNYNVITVLREMSV